MDPPPRKIAAYGSWESPITADQIATKGVSIEDLQVDRATFTVYQIEKRPSEGGRNVVVATASGRDVVKEGWNVRSGVHEYGGAPAIVHDGVLYFSHFGDNRVYKVVVERGEPFPVTPGNKNHRFANFAVHPENTHWLVSVLEDHTNDAPVAVQTTLVLLDTESQAVTTLAKGADFYSRPQFSPNGKMLAWIQWYHPDMSWDGSELIIADCGVSSTGLALSNLRHVAGRRRVVSVAEPTWISNTTLLFTSDKDGYLNPWACVFASSLDSYVIGPIASKPICEDFGEPAWMIGWTSYAMLDPRRGVFMALRRGRAQLYLVDVVKQIFQELSSPYVVIQFLRSAGKDKVVFVGKRLDDEGGIVELTFGPDGHPSFTPIKTKLHTGPTFPVSFISPARPIELKIPPNDQPLHIVYYPPTNPGYTGGLPSEKPPVVVHVHGGPIWMADQALDWKKQFFTSRGWAWIDLNHRGSSGYGREYISRLKGQWGIVEVEDAVECIRQLGVMSLIDDKRAAIRGNSAGGFTTLAMLTTKPTAFAAGASLYGLSDLRKIQEVSHKFESHILEGLVGGTMDEIPKVWEDRSPITRANEIRAPLLIMQGAIDPVVPPAQAEYIVESVRKNGGRVEYVLFQGEGHGWRRAENVQAALEKELAFYEDVFGLGHKI